MGQGNYDYAAASPLLQRDLRFPWRPVSRECLLADDETLSCCRKTLIFFVKDAVSPLPRSGDSSQMEAFFLTPDRPTYVHCQCDLKPLFTPEFG